MVEQELVGRRAHTESGRSMGGQRGDPLLFNAAKQGVFDRLLDRFVLNAQARVVEPQ